MRLVNLLCRYLVGGLFIFSGLIKLNDPYGTAYKLEEYFEVFAADISPLFVHFVPYSLFISIFICAFEVILGCAILFYYRMKTTMWVSLLLILFFTFLTFYSFAFDKVKECGCFGSFIKLTAKESFYKDLVLLVLISILFINRKTLHANLNNLKGDILIGIITILAFSAGYYSKRHLPFVDKSNYRIGNNLDSLTKPLETARYRWIVEKDGKEYAFNEHYPTDTTYKYKDKILLSDSTKLVPKIASFMIYNDEGDFTQEAFKGTKFLIIIANPTDAFENCIGDCAEKMVQLNNYLNQKGIKTMILTATGDSTFQEYRHQIQLSGDYYFMDDTILKTMIRSNPGLLLLKDGVVKGKWHYNDIPEINEFNNALN